VKFPYRREPCTPNPAHKQRATVLRPRIRIRLLYENRFIDLLALVDSGADDCMFPIEVAQDLNLTLDPQKAQRYRGIGTGHITAYFADLTIDIGGTQVPLYAGFS
jgi:hypothetical protein